MWKQTITYFFIRIGNGALSLATIYVFSRLLTQLEYGRYALAMSAISLVSTGFFSWINLSLVRFYPAHRNAPGQLNAQVDQCFAIIALCIFIVTVVVYCATYKREIGHLVIPVGLGSLAMAGFNRCIYTANAVGKPFSYGIVSVSRSSFSILFGVLIVFIFPTAEAVVSGGIAGCLISVFIFSRLMQPTMPHVVGSRTSVKIRDLVGYGVPLSFSTIGIVIVDVADRFMLGYFHGPQMVTSYAACYDLIQQTVGSLLGIFSLAALPHIIREWDENRNSGTTPVHFVRLGNALTIFAPFAVLAIVGFSSEISAFFPTVLRSESRAIVPWIAFAIALGCFKSFFIDVVFQLYKSTGLQIKINAIMATAAVVFNVLLIPRFGVMGAAWSAVATFGLGGAISWLCGRKLISYPMQLSNILKVIFASICALLPMGLSLGGRFENVAFLRGTTVCVIYLSLSFSINACDCRKIITKMISKA